MTRGHWLKANGHARGKLPDAWLEEGRTSLLTRTAFPRRPRMADGDRLVYYASVWQRMFAVVEVVGEPYPRDHERWPWAIDVAPLIVVPRIGDAPSIEAAGIMPRSMSQQSHIRLTEGQYERAVEAIGSLAR